MNGNVATAYPGPDAVAGSVSIYGQTPNNISDDLAVTHWRWVGSSGEYSTHGRTRLFTLSGYELPRSGPTYYVEPGEPFQVEATYEHTGKLPVTAQVGFYLSSNNHITTADTLIHQTHMSFDANQVFTARKTVTLSSSLVPNRYYWIGVIIDNDDMVSEEYEGNNATYIPIKVRKPCADDLPQVCCSKPYLPQCNDGN